MTTLNCWEYKKCGKEPGGANAHELGVCTAATIKLSGINSGKHGGRCCWAVAGTFCGGKVQGTFANKLANCLECEFYNLVLCEEGVNLVDIKDVLKEIEEAANEK